MKKRIGISLLSLALTFSISTSASAGYQVQ